MKIQSEYRENGGEYTLCPKCESFWYNDCDDASTEEHTIEENPEECELFCQNCGEYFETDYPQKSDPSEEMVESWYRELFSDSAWHDLTPTDKRCGYCDYTDSLCKDGTISDFMYHNMSGHSEG